MDAFDKINFERYVCDSTDYRLKILLWTLSMILSPIDMKSIISVKNNKGTLEVTMNKAMMKYLNSETDGEQQVFIEGKIIETWDMLDEQNVVFTYQNLDM